MVKRSRCRKDIQKINTPKTEGKKGEKRLKNEKKIQKKKKNRKKKEKKK